MLSETQVVKTRKALESMYDGVCSIAEYQEYTKTNKSTGHKEVVTLEGQPCRLSFSSFPNTEAAENLASKVVQNVKVFLAPEISVKAGSKLTITQNGVSIDYKSSGEPAIYQTHQEINLELFKGWS